MSRSVWLLIGVLCGPGAATSSVSLEQEMLQAHASVRSRVGLRPLVWSNRLGAVAQDWADQLLAHKQMRHRPDSQYGENIFSISGGGVSPEQVVNHWASEAKNYDYRSNKCRGVCGHYTQIVWRGTRDVGCGVARGGGREVWVCNYSPPGNWEGQRPY